MSKIVFIGDSVTLGVRAGVTQADTFAQKIGAARGFDMIINKGIGGDTSAGGLARFQADVIDQQPDAVCIMFGINDRWNVMGGTTAQQDAQVAAFDSNIRGMVSQAQAAGITVTLMSPSSVNDSAWLVGIKPYSLALMLIAKEMSAAYVDVFGRFWVEFGTVPARANYDALFVDSQHPGPLGHQMIADLVLHPFHADACALPAVDAIDAARAAKISELTSARDADVAAANAKLDSLTVLAQSATTLEGMDAIAWN